MNTQLSAIDADTAVAFHERIPYEACPVCGSGEFAQGEGADCSRHPAWKPPLSPTISWQTCGDCDHRFAPGYFTPEALRLLSDQLLSHHRPGENAEGNRNASASIVGKVQALKSSGRWLDVDCGNGSIMFTAREFGFDVVGLDPREKVVEGMKDLEFPVECGDLQNAGPQDDLDVISMVGALERTPFPTDTIAAVHRMLAPGGVAVFSTPNTDAIVWDMMTNQKTNPYWADLTQYHIFGRRRLFRILEDAGFASLSYSVSARIRCGMDVLAQKA